MTDTQIIASYLDEVKRKYGSDIATEHAYRPALQALIEGLCGGINAINDAKRVEVGAPDFVLTEERQDPRQLELVRSVPLGFVEAKDLRPGILDEPKNKAQLERYMDLGNVVHTDNLTFRFYFDRKLIKEVVLGRVENKQIINDTHGFDDLAYYFKETVSRASRTIRTAKTLALHMADRARPIRRTILKALNDDIAQGESTLLVDQYDAFKKVLIHDLSTNDFADIYAETIAYGLFAARYNDTTMDDFSLTEAAQKVPQSNPFLRQFFLQIAAYEKDPRLDWVLNNFADLFSYADVHTIMSTYGRTTGMNHDPVTHFYETFLGEYDSKRRKARGVYYTPLPVVQYIVRAVDTVLKEEFNLADGLADDSTVAFTQDFGDSRKVRASDGKLRKQTSITKQIPRVQVLDPATGTSTFLNETIKLIADRKAKNLGSSWSNYVEENLLPRIHGFEILMAAYSMAHMRIGLTLAETGYKPTAKAPRLGIYLTNTLEEPAGQTGTQIDMFSSMGRAISEESNSADEVKRDLPIMVVMGNPPYSGESFNKGEFARGLVEKYKKESGGIIKLQERNPKWINDDYVKFLAYAESKVENGNGIVAMITNNGYLDNPTFRGMRWRLQKTFDKIYVIDLHGNSKKKEVAPDGGRDENVFDIMQGVGIIIAVKNNTRREQLAEVYHADFYGKRQDKYLKLGGDVEFNKIDPSAPRHYFVPQNTEGKEEYERGVALNELMPINSVGVVTGKDDVLIADNTDSLLRNVEDFRKEGLGKIAERLRKAEIDAQYIKPIAYRPFDSRYIYYNTDVVERSRDKVMRNLADIKPRAPRERERERERESP